MSNLTRLQGKLGIGAAVMLALVATISIIMLGNRTAKRWDVTATREHALSQRTMSLLSGLTEHHQVVIWGDMSALDGSAKQSVLDTISQFERSGAKLNFSLIDTSGETGKESFAGVVRDLAANNGRELKSYAAAAQALASATDAFGKELSDVVGPAMDHMASTFAPSTREAATRRAQAVRAAGRNLSDLAARTRRDLASDPLGAGVPELNSQAAARPARDAVSTAIEQFTKFANELATVGDAPGASDELVLATRGVVRSITAATDAANKAVAAFNTAKAPAAVRVVDALKSPRGVLLIGPEDPGLLALDFDDLFAPGSRADARRRAEELLATGLASLSSPIRPIAVFTHAESKSVLERGRLFDTLLQRLTLRNFEVIEWPVLTADLPPGLSDLRGRSQRPIVYIIISPDSSASGGASGELPGAQRAQALGKAIARLADDGASMLVSFNPSVIPAAGQPDPVAEAVKRVGLLVDTSRPVFTRIAGAAGSASVSPDAIAVAPSKDDSQPAESPIAGSLRNLRTFVGFPMSVSAEAGARTSALLEIPVADNIWCESQWLAMWQTPAAQRSQLQPIPSYEPGKDARPAVLVIARSVEREHAGTAQRVIAMGSNNWMADFVLNQRTVIDGREVAEYSGNAEMLDASMLWLSRQENLITGSAIAPVPLIESLTAGQLRMLRVLAIAGIPLLVLGCGALYRWING